MATSTDAVSSSVLKQSGPKSLEELRRKGPPTREEIDAMTEKYALGVALTREENDRYEEYYKNRRNASDLATILSVLYPQCEWSIRATDKANREGTVGAVLYENLEWDEDNPLPKPTEAELEKFRPFVQDILDQESYIRMRQEAYPGEVLLVRALWEYVVEGKDDFMNALQARRLAVKKRFPKPENKHWMVQAEDYMKIIPNAPWDILREMDEDTAMRIAFAPGIEGEDAEPLSTRVSLEEKYQEMLEKRFAKKERTREASGFTPAQPTVADIEEAQAKLDEQSGE